MLDWNKVDRAGGELWVDKWKPKNESELVGNPQGQKVIAQFLDDWESVHLHGNAPRPAPGAGSQKKDMTKKAILICGPPGIGKTTAAHIISKCALLIDMAIMSIGVVNMASY